MNLIGVLTGKKDIEFADNSKLSDAETPSDVNRFSESGSTFPYAILNFLLLWLRNRFSWARDVKKRATTVRGVSRSRSWTRFVHDNAWAKIQLWDSAEF